MTDDNTRSQTKGCSENSSEITLETVWSKTQATIKEAVQSGEAVLINAPPGAGKRPQYRRLLKKQGLP